MGKNLAEECVDADWIGLARLDAKGNDLVHTELDPLSEDGSLHPEGLVDRFYRLSTKGHEIYDAYVPGQWLDVDDATNLLPAGTFL